MRTNNLTPNGVLACSLSQQNYQTVAAKVSSLANVIGHLKHRERLCVQVCISVLAASVHAGRKKNCRLMQFRAHLARVISPVVLEDSFLASRLSPLATGIIAHRRKGRKLCSYRLYSQNLEMHLPWYLENTLSAGPETARSPCPSKRCSIIRDLRRLTTWWGQDQGGTLPRN